MATESDVKKQNEKSVKGTAGKGGSKVKKEADAIGKDEAVAALNDSLEGMKTDVVGALESIGKPMLLQKFESFKDELEEMCKGAFEHLNEVDTKVHAHQFTLEQMALRHFFEQFCEEVMPAFCKASSGAEWGIQYTALEKEHELPSAVVDAYRLGLDADGISVEGVKRLTDSDGNLTATAHGAAVHLVEMGRLEQEVLQSLPELNPFFSLDVEVEELLANIMKAGKSDDDVDPMFC